MKRIAYVTTSSNFERQKLMIKALHKYLQTVGDIVLYVLTGYGVYYEDDIYRHGDGAVYSLLEKYDFDGYLVEANIGCGGEFRYIMDLIQAKKKPLITINTDAEGVPVLVMESFRASYDLVEHLIQVHGCKKINMVLNWDKETLSIRALEAYQEVLKKYNIPYEEKRILYRTASIQNGRDLWQDFEKTGIQDAEAVVCGHDVNAIGLCLDMQEKGYRVPEDMIVCSLNYSTNSVIFRPDITGADRMDEKTAEEAYKLLQKLMAGDEIPMENHVSSEVHYGSSCGCKACQGIDVYGRYQELIVGKVEAANQTSKIRAFTDKIEETVSLEQFAENIETMLTGVGIHNFYCCINESDLEYIIGEKDDVKTAQSAPYDEKMVVFAAKSDRNASIDNERYSLSELLPDRTEAGDLIIFLPIHHRERDFGYLVIRNEYYPIEQYNFRNCHESIGSGIENLRRQMILRKSIRELDELHMSDQMTGLYNRFAVERYRSKYEESGEFAVAILDMDGLKVINDNFGHLVGNNAITLTADAIKGSVDENDLCVRYGGDEFAVLSKNTDTAYWEKVRIEIDKKLTAQMALLKLPYELGVSMGYASAQGSFEEIVQIADQRMYADKLERKKARGVV